MTILPIVDSRVFVFFYDDIRLGRVKEAVGRVGGNIQDIAHVEAAFATTYGIQLLIAGTKICSIPKEHLAAINSGDVYIIGRADATVSPDWIYPGPEARHFWACVDGLGWCCQGEFPYTDAPPPYIPPIHCIVVKTENQFIVYDCTTHGKIPTVVVAH